ncbi:hypothetical protein [uncultured Brevibacillus sp.]|uniref:hypothetical protein n=1 Tax=uncultured Brevibacillus sp. TaxID=169970 RepID=UPI0025931478|nr:hypothetical protein [uncultured Brevibacillus sp.]
MIERYPCHFRAAECGGAGRVGCSALAFPGIAVRVFASSTQEIEQLFEQYTRYVRKKWFDLDPVSLRKY